MKNKLFVILLAVLLLLVSCGAPSENEFSNEAEGGEEGLPVSDTDTSKPWHEEEESVGTESLLPEVPKDEEISKDEETSKNEDTSRDEEVSKDENESETENELPELVTKPSTYKPLNYDYIKGVWLTQFDLLPIYRNGDKQRDKASFTELMKTVLDNIKSDGYNTVFVQVRPNADSFYPSEYYPISHYVSGQYGYESIYDPFEIIVSLAHESQISVHAWLNPMRAMKATQISAVSDKYYIKRWYSDSSKKGRYVIDRNGQLYLNPAYASVRSLIACGAAEVCMKYNVDGVHIDDYFYPTTEASSV